MIEAIFSEHSNRDVYNQELIHHLDNTLIIVVARDIAKFLPNQVIINTDEKAVNILQYIRQKIHYPDKLKTGNIGHIGATQLMGY
jgi:AraC family L-rhamnose operon regulatory protein RhaS